MLQFVHRVTADPVFHNSEDLTRRILFTAAKHSLLSSTVSIVGSRRGNCSTELRPGGFAQRNGIKVFICDRNLFHCGKTVPLNSVCSPGLNDLAQKKRQTR